ncbi:hypothetical protein B566_EDAN002769 [Ephemera danica]|nr:hypothetical protein B566_EDAN002769 [Ephemera danica]
MASASVKDVSKYLAAQQTDANKDVAAEWAKLEELYNKKLWHQLTLKIGTFVKHPTLQSGDKLIQLYNNFIQTFENKINPLSLVEILAHVVVQFTDRKEAIQFLQQTEPKVKISNEAVALCKVLSGQIMLNDLQDQDATKKVIDEVDKILDEEDGVTPVHGRYYDLASQLYRLQAKHADFYRAALRYLGCIELDSLSTDEKHKHAVFLGLAALLGDGVYNFGELLAHPVLQVLDHTSEVWLKKLLFAFNEGNIAELERMRPQWEEIPDLKTHQNILREKISLLCLMEMTFKRPSTDRQLTFEEIARETQLPTDQVEFLVMKALSQGLVRGAIDQVAGTVLMTWINSMIQRLNTWCSDVKTMESLLETKAHDFLTL